jgi:hypothetical protein
VVLKLARGGTFDFQTEANSGGSLFAPVASREGTVDHEYTGWLRLVSESVAWEEDGWLTK